MTGTAALAGSISVAGAFTAARLTPDNATLSGSIEIDATFDIVGPPPPLTLVVTMDPQAVDITPRAVQVNVSNARPGESVVLTVQDSTPTTVATIGPVSTDDNGMYSGQQTLPALAAGSYSLVATGSDGSDTGSFPFTIASAPLSTTVTPITVTPPSLPPVEKWRFVDTTTAPHTVYEFPVNPTAWDLPEPVRTFTHRPTTAPDGPILTWEGAPQPAPIKFSGTTQTQAEWDAFQQWVYGIKYRVWLIDHRDTLRQVTLQAFDATNKVGRPDWVTDYTITGIQFDATGGTEA